MRRVTGIVLLMLCFVLTANAQDIFRPTPPENTEVITPENAHRLEALGILGRGTIREIDWSPDSAILGVKTTIGVWIYNSLDNEPFLIEGDYETLTVDQAWTMLAIKQGGQIDMWDIRQLEKRAVTVDLGDMELSRFPLFLSPDGSTLTFLVNRPFEANIEVWQWDVEQNHLKDALPIGSGYISDVSMSPRGDALMVERSGIDSEIVTLADSLERLPLHVGGGAKAFHPDHPLAAFVHYRDGKNFIRIFDYETASEIATLEYPRYSVQLLFTPSGDRLLIRDRDSYEGDLWSWDFTMGEVKMGTGGRPIPTGNIFEVNFPFDERYVIFGNYSRYEQWDLETMAVSDVRQNGQYIGYSEDGTLTAVSDATGVSVFAADDDDTPLAQFPNVRDPVFSPNNQWIAAIDWDGRMIKMYAIDGSGDSIVTEGYGWYYSPGFTAQGELIVQKGIETSLWQPPFVNPALLPAERMLIDQIVSIDQTTSVFGFEIDFGTLRQWTISAVGDSFEVTVVQPRTIEIYTEPQDRVAHVTLSPDARLFVASGGEDPYYEWGVPYLYLRDLETGRYQYLYNHSGQINAIAFSPNGRGFASGSGFITEYYQSDDTTLRLWDVQEVNGVWELVERAQFYYDAPVDEVMFGPNSRLIAARTRNEVSIRDAVTGRELFQSDDGRTSAFAFSPDSRLLATRTDEFLRLWNLETGEEVSRQPLLSESSDILFDPNGRWVATTAMDGVVRLWGVPGDS